MKVLKDLSEAYSRLNTGDARRTELLDALKAVLESYSLYEEILPW